MPTTIDIGTTSYSSSGVAYSGFGGGGGTKTWGEARLFGLRFTGQDESYSTVEFSILSCDGNLPVSPGLPVSLRVSAPDGSAPTLYFKGDLQDPSVRQAEQGWVFSYCATDLKQRADYVPVAGSDGGGVARYNLAPDDDLYLFGLAGLTTGQIVTKVLTSVLNATNLNAVGVGAYASMSPPTLPALTIADLSVLSVVPPTPVLLQGDSILDAIEGLIQRWHAQYTLWVQPDGTIRVRPLFGRTSHTLTVPGGASLGDPVEWPDFKGPSLKGCFTRVQILGLDIQGTVLSTVDGTIKRASTAPNIAAWTSSDFLMPKDASDEGNVSGLTSVNCTVTSDHSAKHWAANYWNGVGGIIYLYYPAGTGIDLFEARQITSCGALSAGGSATVGWDAANPITGTAYTRYKIVGSNTALAEVDRLFDVRDPASGNLGLLSYVGARLYPRDPKGFPWPNGSATTLYFYPAARVLWSRTGAYPWFSQQVEVRLRPDTGQIDLIQPAVFLSAALAGQFPALAGGLPANSFMGLYYDLQVFVPYNRGAITATSPASSYSGTAFTKYGLQRTLYLHMDSFVWIGDSPAMVLLAAEHLATVKNTVLEGSIVMHYDAWTPTFDPLTIGYSLEIDVPGGSPLDGEELPVRSFTMEWPDSGPDIRRLTFNFSTRRRVFEGDDLYRHPTFGTHTFGSQQGQTFVAGQIGEHTGMVDSDALHDTMTGRDQFQSPGEDEGHGGDVGGFEGEMGGGEMGGVTAPRPRRPGGGGTAASRPDFVGPRMSELQPDRSPKVTSSDPEGLSTTPINPNPQRPKLADMRVQRQEEPELAVRSTNPGPASLDDMKPTPEAPAPRPRVERPKLADLRGTRDDDTTDGGG